MPVTLVFGFLKQLRHCAVQFIELLFPDAGVRGFPVVLAQHAPQSPLVNCFGMFQVLRFGSSCFIETPDQSLDAFGIGVRRSGPDREGLRWFGAHCVLDKNMV